MEFKVQGDKIKTKVVESLIQQGYLVRDRVDAKDMEAIDEAIKRRVKFNVIDLHVEALFTLEGLIPTADRDSFDWRKVFNPNDK